MPNEKFGNSIHEDCANHIKKLEMKLHNAMKSVRIVIEVKKNSKIDLIIRLRQAHGTITYLRLAIRETNETLSSALAS